MARGAAIVENFADLLDSRFAKIYQTEYDEGLSESMIDMLYGKKTGKGNYEMMSGIGALADVPDFDGTLAYDSPSQLYDVTVNFPEKARGIKVERMLYDDDLFGIMDQRPKSLADSIVRTREKAGAEVFNNIFTDTTPGTRTGGDGVAICSASHPYSPDDATTQSNAGSTALSATSIEATRRIGLTSIYSDRGELLDINYDLILAPINLEETAWEIINSKGKVETANNNRNFHYGRYQLAIWRRLTDSNNWFFIDSRLMKQFNLWYDRVKPEFEMDRDFDTKVAKWSVYWRHGICPVGWQWIYGHNVS
jgi:hypothetical protein